MTFTSAAAFLTSAFSVVVFSVAVISAADLVSVSVVRREFGEYPHSSGVEVGLPLAGLRV